MQDGKVYLLLIQHISLHSVCVQSTIRTFPVECLFLGHFSTLKSIQFLRISFLFLYGKTRKNRESICFQHLACILPSRLIKIRVHIIKKIIKSQNDLV